MSRVMRWVGLLLIIDFAVSAALLATIPDKTHATMACLSEAVTK